MDIICDRMHSIDNYAAFQLSHLSKCHFIFDNDHFNILRIRSYFMFLLTVILYSEIFFLNLIDIHFKPCEHRPQAGMCLVS